EDVLFALDVLAGIIVELLAQIIILYDDVGVEQAGQVEWLGSGIDEHDAVGVLAACDYRCRYMFVFTVGKVLMDLVGNDEYIVFFTNGEHPFQFIFRPYASRRVMWRA